MNKSVASIVLCTIALALAGFATAFAADNAKTMAQAVEAYNNEDYNQALGIYLEQATVNGTSSDLYYNIGCAYYRLKDYPNAILYYERALKLDPSNRQASKNLAFVREKAQISEEDSLSATLGNALTGLFSSNTWAWIALIAFLLTLAGVSMYMFLDNVALRKSGFFGGIILAVVSVSAICAAVHNRNVALTQVHGIVMGEQAIFSTAPRAPKDSSEVVMHLVRGQKVQVIDSINDGNNSTEPWYDIKAPGAKRAWVKAKDIVII